MRYVGSRNPRAEYNPLRSIPLFRSPVRVFGPTARDRLVGAVRQTAQLNEGWAREYAKVRAALGKANRVPVENRRHCQAHAMRQLNAIRAAMKANLRATARAQAALDAFDRNPPLPGFEEGGRHTMPRLPFGPAWPPGAAAAAGPAA